MRIAVTDDAVMLTEIDEPDRQFIELLLRRSAGKSLILPVKPKIGAALSDEEELEMLISCMRTSAQDTLAALRRRGVRLVRRAES
jgi:hypothetical protein